MASNPRINSSLAIAIQIAKSSPVEGSAEACNFVHSQNQPGKANRHESGKKSAFQENIFVTVPPDHFGPILAENDLRRKQGVLVGQSWEDWIECGQWGAHVSHTEGISGQSDHGAQSVAFSGGKEVDEDHGDWFIYTGRCIYYLNFGTLHIFASNVSICRIFFQVTVTKVNVDIWKNDIPVELIYR